MFDLVLNTPLRSSVFHERKGLQFATAKKRFAIAKFCNRPGVVVITAQLYSTKLELSFGAGSNTAHSMSEI